MDEERIRSAAEIAQATEFIDAKAEGMQTAISQGGTNVSGGQRQRLSIARAWLPMPVCCCLMTAFLRSITRPTPSCAALGAECCGQNGDRGGAAHFYGSQRRQDRGA